MSGHSKITDKALAAWANAAWNAGWTVKMTGSGHLRFQSPTGAVVFTPTTPNGGRRSMKNARAQLRRAGLKI